MKMLLMGTVVVLTIASIVLQSINLANHHNDCTSSVLSIVFLALMFVIPMLKRFLGDIGQWIFIVVAVASLLAQSYAYGEHINDDSNTLLGISVVATLVASYLGHKFKDSSKRKVIRNESVRWYMLIHIAKFVLASLSTILVIVNLTNHENVDGVIVLLIASLIIYISLAGLSAFVSPEGQVQLYVEFLCGLERIQMLRLNTGSKGLKIISGAVALSGLSILVGDSGNGVDITALVAMVLALVCDHIAVMYYRDGYMDAVNKYMLQRI